VCKKPILNRTLVKYGYLLYYFVFIAAIEENPILQRYDIANGINTFKASVTNSGYSHFFGTAKTYNCSNENSNCKILSADNSIGL
jgi:hypothetical protein